MNLPEETLPEKPEEFQKPEPVSERTNILKTVISLAVYIGVYLLLLRGHLSSILLLVIVIFLHEMGHFIAMKRFGYRDVQMFFIPFMGAYVSGEPHRVSQFQKAVTLLAGPIPGIILGLLFGWLYFQTSHQFYFQASILFLLLNVFNLLPVSPLDGGQLMETIFFHSSRSIQTVFIIVSSVLLAVFAIRSKQWLFLILVPLLLLRLRSMNNLGKIRRQLDKEGVNYHQTYEELTVEEYWQIRKAMIPHTRQLRDLDPDRPDEDEEVVIGYMKPVLNPASQQDLSKGQKLVIFSVWLAGLSLPVFFYYYFDWRHFIRF